MFGIGMPEFILILVVALIVIGPKKLPEVARTLGKAMGEFKRATSELRSAVNIDDDLDEMKQSFKEVKSATYDAIDSAPKTGDAQPGMADRAPQPEPVETDAPPMDEASGNKKAKVDSAFGDKDNEPLNDKQKDSPDND
ncbi:MAG: Sec-independent protein translocase protein TatB [Thermodesulfobacteriota bacterium]|nr:Sec-independent protein translocase protein TatB [Thermodesulfobacteriota bacterium]